jgi:ABC-type glycerol-3-phosphate transport system substrate-binding protein
MQFKLRKVLVAVALTAATAAASMAGSAQAGTLAINIAFKGASQRAVWQQVIDEFKKAHPGTTSTCRLSMRKPTRCNCRAGCRPSRPTS